MHIYANAKILRHINAESFLLLEFTGSSAHAARHMRPGVSPGALAAIVPPRIEKRRCRSTAFPRIVRLDGARKLRPYSESMNPRRRSLTVVSFSSA